MSNNSSLFSKLNPAQLKAVKHESGPAIVLAGAGSGKTTVLTARVGWLIENHIAVPTNIMVVTFTNKAAKEIKNRILSSTGYDIPFAGTFHSLASRILRKDGYHIGLNPSFVIYDSDDQKALLKQIYKEKHFDPKEFNPNAVKAAISKAKNEALSVEEYKQIAIGEFQNFVARVYKVYQHYLNESQAVDFDDLLVHTYTLLRDKEEIREKYQQQFTHVLVDEYQDTNRVQYLLTKLLAAPQNNLYVVGDFSQSIYAWRGADYRNMMLLKEEFSDITEYRLEQNYRSHQSILDAATAVIAQNTSHPILELWTDKASETLITCIQSSDNMTEAFRVARALKEHRDEYPYSDMAVLYRTNAQSRALEEALIATHIPYQLIGGTKFYERKEIKDVIAYIRYAINQTDQVSHERIAKLGVRRLKALNLWIEKMTPDYMEKHPPAELLKELLEITDYLAKYQRQDTPENQSRIENVRELVNVSAQFANMTQFLENVALIQDGEFSDVETEFGASEDKVSLMSLHTAKGLEFSVVCIVGMEEGLFPHSRTQFDPQEIEEERRLCYVGITRAKQKLYLTHARTRFQYGTRMNSVRSRFVQDIPRNLLDLEGYGGQDPDSPEARTGNQERRYVPLDDDLLDGVLSGEVDVRKLVDF